MKGMKLVKWPPFRKWHLGVSEDTTRTDCGVYIRSGQVYHHDAFSAPNSPIFNDPDTVCYNCVSRSTSKILEKKHEL